MLTDDGKYTAIVDGEEITANLIVEDYCEILKPLKDQTITENEPLYLVTEVSDKNAIGKWFKDGKPLENTPDMIITVAIFSKHFLLKFLI